MMVREAPDEEFERISRCAGVCYTTMFRRVEEIVKVLR
jgi:ABC-type arginine transport system permease subunit